MIIALALAAELGLNAPSYLKDCDKPRIDTGKRLPLETLRHIKRLETCGELHPFALFPEKEALIDYTPAPETQTFSLQGGPLPSEAGLSEDEEQPTAGGESGAGALVAIYARPSIANFGPILVQQPALFQVAPVPEPRAWLLTLAGLAALSVWKRSLCQRA